MKTHKSAVDKLEKALIVAHQVQAGVSVGSDWQANLMREIRRLDRIIPVTNIFQPGIMIWRFASVTASVALLFFVCSMSLGLTPNYGLAWAWFYDPTGVLTTSFLGN